MRNIILAICGSTRQQSSNLELIQAIKESETERADIIIYQGLATVPHFNPDLDTEDPPEAVTAFRQQLNEADGILIFTPEYAMGVPGTLKNAIDWTVSSMEFSHKPVALITSSTLGNKAHASLLETLKIIECDIPDTSQLVISHIKTKLKGGVITDASTAEQVKQLMRSLYKTINQKQ